ncbi:uncharacterized protein [Petaurus breviceps papuanus]|uniref:uncharacterized protein n=1 Tax=Petaurus breviceps papuanus TaxID=3040969 RepID=UPI0036DA0FCE
MSPVISKFHFMEQAQQGLQLLAQAALQMGATAATFVAESEEAEKTAALAQTMQANLNQAIIHTQRTLELISSLLIEPQMPAVFQSLRRSAHRGSAFPTHSRLWRDLRAGRLDPQCWRQTFRMSKETFYYICDQLTPYLQHEATQMKLPLSVPRKVAIGLYHLASPVPLRCVAELFGVGRSTAGHTFHEVVDAICMGFRHLLENQCDLEEVMEMFWARHSFPMCAGAIGSTHIEVRCPKGQEKDYWNQHQYFSVILQAVADPRLRFSQVFVGSSGSSHDSHMLEASQLCQKGNLGNLFPPIHKEIGGQTIGPVLVGDEAYPLREWLMVPCHHPATPEELCFNERLSSAQETIDQAFRQLRGRWQCLLAKAPCRAERIGKVITGCCLLHNLCIDRGEVFPHEWDSGLQPRCCIERSQTAEWPADDEAQRKMGQQVRQAIIRYLALDAQQDRE